MLGSYGLLGIFVYCEHKAGPPPHTPTPALFPPSHLFWLPVLLSVDGVKINGDIHTDQGGQENQKEEAEEEDEEEVVVVWWRVTAPP